MVEGDVLTEVAAEGSEATYLVEGGDSAYSHVCFVEAPEDVDPVLSLYTWSENPEEIAVDLDSRDDLYESLFVPASASGFKLDVKGLPSEGCELKNMVYRGAGFRLQRFLFYHRVYFLFGTAG